MRVVSKTRGSNLRTTQRNHCCAHRTPAPGLPPSLSGPPTFTAARVNGLNGAFIKHHRLWQRDHEGSFEQPWRSHFHCQPRGDGASV